jgi:hypothetical protein
MPPQTKELTWAAADLDDSAERKALIEQEMDQAGERASAAFQRLKDLGIMDEKGDLISQDLPPDMRSGAKRDFGG